MKKNIHIATVIACCLMAVSTQVSAAPVIAPIAAYSRAVFHPGGPTTAWQLYRADREVGGQFMVGQWNPTVDQWPFASGGPTEDDWVYIDLGAEYDLQEIRIWNAFDNVDDGPMVWRTKNMSVHVAGAGAVLPDPWTAAGPTAGALTTDVDTDGLRNYFMDASWTKVHDGDLPQGPAPSTITEDQLLNPERVLSAGYNGVRYIAIDIDSRYAGTTGLTALGHIQVTGAPSPTPGTLIYGK